MIEESCDHNLLHCELSRAIWTSFFLCLVCIGFSLPPLKRWFKVGKVLLWRRQGSNCGKQCPCPFFGWFGGGGIKELLKTEFSIDRLKSFFFCVAFGLGLWDICGRVRLRLSSLQIAWGWIERPSFYSCGFVLFVFLVVLCAVVYVQYSLGHLSLALLFNRFYFTYKKKKSSTKHGRILPWVTIIILWQHSSSRHAAPDKEQALRLKPAWSWYKAI